jgi:cation/acetate symporter
MLAVLVLARFGMSPAALFAAAAERYGAGVLAPGKLVTSPLDAISLGLALMFGTAGLPHILMRFYTVPDARAARTSVFYATGLIGAFYLMTFVLGFGAMVLVGPERIRAVDPGGNMAAPLLAELLGGTPFLGFIAAVAFATILAVVAGLTLSGAAALSHDLWVNVVRGGDPHGREELAVARVATVGLGVVAIVLGIAFRGQNVAFMVSLAFAIAASANFPALILSIFWSRCSTAGAVAAMAVGTVGTLALIALSPTVQVELLGGATAWFPLRNPALVTIPAAFVTGILVSLRAPEAGAAARYAAVERRMLLGG